MSRPSAWDRSPSELRERIRASGLRGRGGGQFPVASKWQAVACEDGPRVVVANGAEGEPGSIKDRFVMTTRPRDVLLGLALAARAVDASEAFVYLKGSFHGAAEALAAALAAADFPHPPIEIRRGEESYVVGEETALLESLEGRRAWPRAKPPYPAAVGYRGRPTLVQNVETLARVPAAVEDPASFRDSAPLLVSLWGHVARPGVYEVGAATTLAALVEIQGGGAPDGISLVFPAGPSAPPLPPERLDTPLEADALAAAGSALGTASVLVIGASCDPRSVLESLAAFFERESCGQCPPCTVGTGTLHRIAAAAAAGTARAQELQHLTEAGAFMKDHGYCAHCRTAAAGVTALFARAQAESDAAASCRPFDSGSKERRAIEAVAAGFAAR